jgi:hypothetical protein
MPANATSQKIEWTITGATRSDDGSDIVFNQAGTARITATIAEGLLDPRGTETKAPYTQTWTVVVGGSAGANAITVGNQTYPIITAGFSAGIAQSDGTFRHTMQFFIDENGSKFVTLQLVSARDVFAGGSFSTKVDMNMLGNDEAHVNLNFTTATGSDPLASGGMVTATRNAESILTLDISNTKTMHSNQSVTLHFEGEYKTVGGGNSDPNTGGSIVVDGQTPRAITSVEHTPSSYALPNGTTAKSHLLKFYLNSAQYLQLQFITGTDELIGDKFELVAPDRAALKTATGQINFLVATGEMRDIIRSNTLVTLEKTANNRLVVDFQGAYTAAGNVINLHFEGEYKTAGNGGGGTNPSPDPEKVITFNGTSHPIVTTEFSNVSWTSADGATVVKAQKMRFYINSSRYAELTIVSNADDVATGQYTIGSGVGSAQAVFNFTTATGTTDYAATGGTLRVVRYAENGYEMVRVEFVNITTTAGNLPVNLLYVGEYSAASGAAPDPEFAGTLTFSGRTYTISKIEFSVEEWNVSSDPAPAWKHVMKFYINSAEYLILSLVTDKQTFAGGDFTFGDTQVNNLYKAAGNIRLSDAAGGTTVINEMLEWGHPVKTMRHPDNTLTVEFNNVPMNVCKKPVSFEFSGAFTSN